MGFRGGRTEHWSHIAHVEEDFREVCGLEDVLERRGVISSYIKGYIA